MKNRKTRRGRAEGGKVSFAQVSQRLRYWFRNDTNKKSEDKNKKHGEMKYTTWKGIPMGDKISI